MDFSGITERLLSLAQRKKEVIVPVAMMVFFVTVCLYLLPSFSNEFGEIPWWMVIVVGIAILVGVLLYSVKSVKWKGLGDVPNVSGHILSDVAVVAALIAVYFSFAWWRSAISTLLSRAYLSFPTVFDWLVPGLFIFSGIFFVGVILGKGDKSTKDAKPNKLGVFLRHASMAVIVLQLALAGVLWYEGMQLWGKKECTLEHPCFPIVLEASGSTDKLLLPSGKSLCLDPREFIPDRARLGFTTSYLGKSCSDKEQAAGKCSQSTLDHFWFTPEGKNVQLPLYWFVNQGVKECGFPT